MANGAPRDPDAGEHDPPSPALIRANRRAVLGELVAGIAHALTNPATSISLGVARIARVLGSAGGADGDAAAGAGLDRDEVRGMAETVSAVDEAAERLLRLAAVLREVARGSGDGAIADVNPVIRSCVALMTSQDHAHVSIDVELEEVPPVTGDDAAVAQVVLNLLLRAARSPGTPPAPRRIAVRSCAASGWVRVTIEDDGPSPSADERAFSPDAGSSATGDVAALAVSRHLARQLGGDLRIEPAAERGTRFVVELQPRTRKVVERSAAATAGKLLIIDDEPALARAVAREVRDRFRADVASSAEKALVRLELGFYDVVLCDVRMPGMDGHALFLKVLDHDEAQAARFIFLSGDPDDPVWAPRLAATRQPVIGKPFSVEDLLGAVDRVIADRPVDGGR